MNYINNSIKYIVSASIGSMFFFGILIALPVQAQAFSLGQLIDPACLFACKNSGDKVTKTYTYTNSNNTNSNINSPDAVINVNTSPVAYSTPVYNYNYDYTYHSNQSPIQVSCYPTPLSSEVGERVSWHANAYGGNGSYNISWSGTDGLSGIGESVSKYYNNSGYKNATVTVRSGSQTITRNCDGSVNVRDNYNYNNYYPYNYSPSYYSPLSVSCSVNSTSVSVGNSVRWNAYVSGGNGSYGYSWNGTDGLSGSSQYITRSYNNPGQKYGSVTVWSNGQTVTQNCNNSVNVYGYAYVNQYPTYPVYQVSNYGGGLDIACYSDPRTVTVNQPATWITDVTGGIAPYTYTWSGSDGLTGNTASVIKYYDSPGNKTAIISIRSADGRSESRACSTSITVRSVNSSTTITPAPQPTVENEDNALSAAALFSLKNIPWGWVIVLIILVLFGTIIYLIYNRPKL